MDEQHLNTARHLGGSIAVDIIFAALIPANQNSVNILAQGRNFKYMVLLTLIPSM